jgi:2-oxoglutarate dehydrogenase E1 component
MKIAADFALKWRENYEEDCIIRLVGYRKHGHNEADEPAATQPLMYQIIRNKESILELYEKSLIEKLILTKDQAHEVKNTYRERLTKNIVLTPWPIHPRENRDLLKPYYAEIPIGKASSTSITEDYISRLGAIIQSNISHVALHSRVKKIYDERLKMLNGNLPIDWGCGEMIAFSSLLQDGRDIRLSGQDAQRGTFFQRHCVVQDQNNGKGISVLNGFSGKFEAINSLLSEVGVLGFEYGVSIVNLERLVIWEAQFGDFANGAQVIIDQYIASGEQKWGQNSRLVLLLPHGYEGQGPEHSSARIERFLQLAAQHNMRICYPSTSAQYFHLLRNQLLSADSHPLIVFTPKSLLRNPLAASQSIEFIQGRFKSMIADRDNTSKISRLVFCTGKIYFELKEYQKNHQLSTTVIIRCEQLFPFPKEEFCKILLEYSLVRNFLWTQEEPENQGAWTYMEKNIRPLLHSHQSLLYSGRPAQASTATGWHHQHISEQESLIRNTFE